MVQETNKLEEIREKLIKTANAAPHGSHVKVARKVEISLEYLNQIRVGRNATTDNEKNRKLLSDILVEYKNIIQEEINKLNTL